MQTKEEAFARLAKSKFRSSFHLTAAEKAWCAEKGGEVLRRHAADFVRQKLAPAYPVNDGKQTPMHGHPVFKAMHRGSENRPPNRFFRAYFPQYCLICLDNTSSIVFGSFVVLKKICS